MKLSFYILAHWLEDYEPLTIIDSGACSIDGVRLLSSTTKPKSNLLYVGRSRDFFEDSVSEEILIVHRKEVMSLTTYDLEDVFNKVIEAFEFYAEWERKLFEAASSAKPQQEIIDCCAGVIEPMFFVDLHLNVPAFSKQYGMDTVNENWNDFWQYGTFSFKRFNDMKNSTFMQMFNHTWHCAMYEEPEADYYIHSIMMSQVNREQDLIGQLVYISNEPFEQWQIQLAQTVNHVLSLIESTVPAERNDSAAQFLLKEILTSTTDNLLDNERLRFFQNWEESERIGILCFVPVKPLSNKALLLLAEKIVPFFPESIVITIDDSIVCCLPHSSVKGLERVCCDLAEKSGLVGAVSYFYEGTNNLRCQYRQAKETIPFCSKQSRTFLSFHESALEILAGYVDDKTYQQLCIHPTLNIIKRYDHAHQTQFFATLQTYLQNERSRAKTAKALYMHKNTLVYRLQKLQQLFDLDLDNSYEREYLLFSFRMESNTE